eukprot:Skav230155  [mRNA]  locus=scaffold1301:593076:600876:- [translate_table: standard]
MFTLGHFYAILRNPVFVTHVCLEERPEYLPRLHEVASSIRHLDLRRNLG